MSHLSRKEPEKHFFKIAWVENFLRIFLGFPEVYSSWCVDWDIIQKNNSSIKTFLVLFYKFFNFHFCDFSTLIDTNTSGVNFGTNVSVKFHGEESKKERKWQPSVLIKSSEGGAFKPLREIENLAHVRGKHR